MGEPLTGIALAKQKRAAAAAAVKGAGSNIAKVKAMKALRAADNVLIKQQKLHGIKPSTK